MKTKSSLLIVLLIPFLSMPASGQLTAEYWMNYSLSLASQGRYADAVLGFDSAIKMDPKNMDARFWKGAALYSQGKYAEALQCYDEALDIDSSLPQMWNARGLTLVALGRYEEALKSYDKAIRRNPKLAGS